MGFPKLIVKSGKDKSLLRFHPWVFSGAIKKIKDDSGREATPKNGDIIEVVDNKDDFLGIAHYQEEGSISARVFSFKKVEINEAFWLDKVKTAYQLREKIGLTDGSLINAYRLVFAEGDGLPGLIMDYYDGVVVIQTGCPGMNRLKPTLTEVLKQLYTDRLKAVYDKDTNTYLYTTISQSELIVNEYGSKMYVDWESGQKTGFFIDQRENRKLLADFSKGKRVLNTFCYTGGFSVSALQGGADFVCSVDSSAKAIELTKRNIELNGFTKHDAVVSDTQKYLIDTQEKYDVIVLDPPAYAKNKNVMHNAVQGYKRLNASALEKINKGGILFTFSCSQVVNRHLFYNTIMAAAITVGREVKVLHHLSQPADHPVNIYHPEGEYLKGLVLLVE